MRAPRLGPVGVFSMAVLEGLFFGSVGQAAAATPAGVSLHAGATGLMAWAGLLGVRLPAGAPTTAASPAMIPVVAPRTPVVAPGSTPILPPSAGSTTPAELPFVHQAEEISRAARPLPPPARPISAAELRGKVSTAVVVLAIAGGKSPPRVATGVVVTASGLVLTSRRGVAEAIDGTATISIVYGGPHHRLGSHELRDAVRARIIGVADDLDLALVEALPEGSVFYPHLPLARRSSAAGVTALAIGHGDRRGFWSATPIVLGAATGASGPARWWRGIAGDTSDLPAGAPLIDAVGRVVGMVAQAPGGEPRVVDADALMRFLLALDAPALRFAGLPSFRRSPSPGSALVPAQIVAPARDLAPAAAELASAGIGLEPEMPGIVSKGNLDRRFPTPALTKASPTNQTRDQPRALTKAPVEVSFTGANPALLVSLSTLERHPVPASVKVDPSDCPDRGPMGVPVTVVELGDYHAPQTREAEALVRELVEGPDARARLFWKDTDRGEGAAYQVAARAGHAAREQDAFWSMHDRLMKGPVTPTARTVHQIAQAIDLDVAEFDTAFNSDGLVAVLQSEAEISGRLPVLTTPSFIVNGRVVDGGSVAAAALRAAVDEELILADAKLEKSTIEAAEAAVTRHARQIEAGRSVAGTAYDGVKIARAAADAATRPGGQARTRSH